MLVLAVPCSDYRISIIHLSPGVKKIFESILFISIAKKMVLLIKESYVIK